MYSYNVYIAGAGISLDSPANFPIANHIIEEILNYISPNQSIREEFLRFRRKDNRNHLKGDYIRFELLMDVFSSVDKKLEILDFVNNYHTPNLNHYYLAQAAINGDIIFTPNFDDLIERAILDLGYHPISICYEKDFRVANVKHMNKQVPIYKIHGSYLKHLGFNRKVKLSKGTMQASLTSISSANALFSLSKSKFDCIEYFIKNSNKLIIVGYSGGDDFDIIPSLIKIKPDTVYWIQHSNSIDYENKISSILDNNNKIHETLRAERDRFIINQHKYRASSIKYFETNTLEYLSSCIKSDLVDTNILSLMSTGESFRTHIQRWASAFIDTETRKFLSAELFYRLSEYDKAYSQYNKLDRKSPLYLKSILAAGAALIKRGEFRAAKSILTNSKITSKDSKEVYCKYLEQMAYCAANLSEQSGDIKDIERQFKFAILECLKNKQLSTLTTAYNDFALFLRDIGDLSGAMDYFRRSRNLAIKLGNIRHQAWVYFNMACMFYDRGQFKQSLKYNLKSKEIANSLGDFHQMSNIENLNGVNYLILGNLNESIKAIRKGIYMEYSQDNEYNTTVDWLIMGQIFYELGRFKTSLNCYNKSTELFEKSDDKTYLHELNYFKTILYIRLGKPRLAEYHYLQINQHNTKREKILSEIMERVLYANKFRSISKYLVDLFNMQEITLYLNSIYYFTLLNVKPNLIGHEHLKRSLEIYRRIGNLKRFREIKEYMKKI